MNANSEINQPFLDFSDTKFAQRKSAISSDILQMLPVLTYAEGEVKKTPTKPSEELYGVLVQHMQNYAALINPGLAQSPSQAVNVSPAQCDAPVANKCLYSSLEWTNGAWQNLRLYLSNPVSFQLPVSKASEILLAGQEKKMEEDNVYLLLSSPDKMQTSQVYSGPEGQPSGQNSAVTSETPSDSCTNSAEAQAVAPCSVKDLQPHDVKKDAERSDISLLTNTDHMGATNLLTPSTSDDLPAELIVSFTSAERTCGSVINNKTKMKEFQLSVPAAELQTAGGNAQDVETVATKKVFQSPKLVNHVKIKPRRMHSVHFGGRKHVSKARVETCSLQTVASLTDSEGLNTTESSGHSQWNNISNIEPRNVQKYKLGSPLKDDMNFSVEGGMSDPGQREAVPLRKKLEHLDIKPVISACGRILVPHGCVYQISDQIKALKDEIQSRRVETNLQNLSVAAVNAHDAVKRAHEPSKVPETTVDVSTATTSTDGGDLPQIDLTHHRFSNRSADEDHSLTLSPESSEYGSKDVGPASQGKCETKGVFLQSQQNAVLVRGKRKPREFVSEEMTDNISNADSSPKRGRVDTHSEMLRSNDAVARVTDPDVDIKKFSVDPHFAYILGLTPKETSDKMQKSEGLGVSHTIDPSKTQAPTISDQRPQIIQIPLSMFSRKGGRIKTLKKHQGISAEHVKKNCKLYLKTLGLLGFCVRCLKSFDLCVE